MINRVHVPAKVNHCNKCEQDPLNIVGCRVVTNVRRTGGKTSQGTTIPYDLNGPGVKNDAQSLTNNEYIYAYDSPLMPHVYHKYITAAIDTVALLS